MRTSLKKKVGLFITVQVISGLIGSLVGIPKYYGVVDSMWPVLSKGFFLGFVGSGILVWLDQVYFEARLKKVSLMVSLMIKSTAYLSVVVSVFLVATYLFRRLLPMQLQLSMMVPTVLVTYVFVLVATFLLGMTRLLGSNVLINFVTGRYHHPTEEERIFVFMDLVASTSIAEKIGNLQFHAFLNDFFCDISEEIIEHGGEIYKYVGDEAIVVWKMQSGGGNRHCIDCYYAIVDKMQDKKSYYLDEYGFVPALRVGMHCGTAIVGEMGGHRREIVFLGDVVNTAARIQGECKETGKELLISKDLAQRILLPANVNSVPIGKVSLKGKEEPMELFEITRA